MCMYLLRRQISLLFLRKHKYVHKKMCENGLIALHTDSLNFRANKIASENVAVAIQVVI